MNAEQKKAIFITTNGENEYRFVAEVTIDGKTITTEIGRKTKKEAQEDGLVLYLALTDN